MISILVPIYNAAPFLPQCLDSIVGQTYSDLQIVLVDDGSKDNSLAIANEYAARDSRIEVYHQENQGVAAARNALLDKVRGEYVLFVDADDWIEPDMVEFLVKYIQVFNAEMITCGMVFNDKIPSKSFSANEYTQSEAVKEFLRHKSFNGSLWNKLFKTTILHSDSRFRLDVSYGEDALFCWELLKDVTSVMTTDRQLYHYRMNDCSISHASYDCRKMSGHFVWQQISDETVKLWPQYKSIADASYAISDMWQLYYALKSKYPKDDNIRLFQKHVRENLTLIHRSGLVNLKKFLFSCIVAYSYRLGGMII